MSEFKQCPNGHYYQGVSCPYCKTKNQFGGTSVETGFYDYPDELPTETGTFAGGSRTVNTKTDIIVDTKAGTRTQMTGSDPVGPIRPQSPVHSRTVFGGDETEDKPNTNGSTSPKKEPRYGRKLVGWLVTYSFDECGVDYKLYEGRNIIGRDLDCNITVNDGRMSGKHAVLLFRANKYSLTDSQSSHGTWVNGEDIDLEPRYLKDGDIIRMGSTEFTFRTSL